MGLPLRMNDEVILRYIDAYMYRVPEAKPKEKAFKMFCIFLRADLPIESDKVYNEAYKRSS